MAPEIMTVTQQIQQKSLAMFTYDNLFRGRKIMIQSNSRTSTLSKNTAQHSPTDSQTSKAEEKKK